MTYPSKIKYNQKYVRERCKQVTLMLNKSTDADIIAYLDTKDNKNGYLKDLIRQEMKGTKK